MSVTHYGDIKICRLCESNNNLFNIFTAKCIDVLKISNCVNIEIEENDLLPKWVCSECNTKIEEFSKFQVSCKDTEKKLLATIENTSLELNLCHIEIKEENELVLEEFNFSDTSIKYNFDNYQPLDEKNCTKIEQTDILSMNTTLNKKKICKKNSIHNSDKVSCDVCNKVYASKVTLNRHKKIHPQEIQNTNIDQKCQPLEQKESKCEVCNKVLANKKMLKIHTKMHTQENLHECKHCFKTFNFRENLNRHIKNVHEQLRPHTCDLCGKSFTQKVGLQSHESVHITEKKITCNICDKSFRTTFQLNIHKTSHLPTFKPKKVYKYNKSNLKLKTYVCSYCGKTFHNNLSFNSHIRCHTGEKPYECDVCGIKFSQYLTMRNHHNIHTDIKPYKCKECGKDFRQHSHLKVHIKIHTGERPFPCIECEKSFKTRADLVLHTRRHTGERPFECSFCTKKYIEKRLLQRHIAKIHENGTTSE